MTLTSNLNQKQYSYTGKFDALNLFNNLNKSVQDFHNKNHLQDDSEDSHNPHELNYIQKYSIEKLLNNECS